MQARNSRTNRNIRLRIQREKSRNHCFLVDASECSNDRYLAMGRDEGNGEKENVWLF